MSGAGENVYNALRLAALWERSARSLRIKWASASGLAFCMMVAFLLQYAAPGQPYGLIAYFASFLGWFAAEAIWLARAKAGEK